MDDIALARVLHILAVIHWIGGLAFATLVILPLARSYRKAEEGLALFKSVERRFSFQARLSILLAGGSGPWMTYRLGLWDRFIDPEFWWMGAMLGLWLVFVLMLFVIEPLLHAKFKAVTQRNPAATLRYMKILHRFLLVLATLTTLGAMAGAHGFAVI